MKPQIKKVTGAVSLIAVTIAFVASAVLKLVGLSTAPDDALALKEKLPGWANWLMTAPWWFILIIALAIMAYAVWALWPDMALRDEMRQLRNDYQAANDRAWEFSANHQALLDRFDAIEAKLNKTLSLFETETATLNKQVAGAIENSERLYWKYVSELENIKDVKNEVQSLVIDLPARLERLEKLQESKDIG